MKVMVKVRVARWDAVWLGVGVIVREGIRDPGLWERVSVLARERVWLRVGCPVLV